MLDVLASSREGQAGASELFSPDSSCLLAGGEPPRCQLPASSAALGQHRQASAASCSRGDGGGDFCSINIRRAAGSEQGLSFLSQLCPVLHEGAWDT